MRKYVGPGIVPGVPAQDLTEEDYQEHERAGRLPKDSPAAACYEKVEPGARRGGSDGGGKD